MIADKVEIWQVDISQINEYEKIPMLVHVKKILKPSKVNNGLGGIILAEVPVKEYVKDLGQSDNKADIISKYDTTNWAFFIAYINKMPVGGAIVAANTQGVDMLDEREDLAVLWDLRVNDRYQKKGIGIKLFQKAVDWAKENKYRHLKIECQNNNVKACRFYAKRGAILSQIDEFAYYKNIELRDEIQLIWYLDLLK